MNFTTAEKASITAWAQEKVRGQHDGPAGLLCPQGLHPAYIHGRMSALVAALARTEKCRQIDIINGPRPDSIIWPWDSLEDWEGKCQEAICLDREGEAKLKGTVNQASS